MKQILLVLAFIPLIFAIYPFDQLIQQRKQYNTKQNQLYDHVITDAEGLAYKEKVRSERQVYIPIKEKSFRDLDETVDLAERDGTPPPTWTCDPSYYNASDGCDCGCGAPDPDCNDPDEEIFCPDPTQICVNATCVYPPIAGWLCSPGSYNQSDGCDCDCGILDPDCNDPNQPVLNCDYVNITFPYLCDKSGNCRSRPNPPVRLQLDFDYPIYAECGKVVAITFDPEYVSIPVKINLLDGEWKDFKGDSGKFDFDYNITAVPLITNPNEVVTFAGSVTESAAKGTASFDKLVVLGKSGTEFFLKFVSNPPLIPAVSLFTVRIEQGDPVDLELAWDGQDIDENGHYRVATDSNITAKVNVFDDCGNAYNQTVAIDCLSYDHEDFYPAGMCPGEGSSFYDGAPITNTMVTFTMPSTPGDYDLLFFAGDNTTHIQKSIGFNVIDKAQYHCFDLLDFDNSGVQTQDIANFDSMMVPNDTKLNLSLSLFSTDQDRPNILRLLFAQSNLTTPFHSPLSSTYNTWVLAAKHFFVEQDPQFLQVISLGLVSVDPTDVNVNLMMPWCGSMSDDKQKDILGRWVYDLSDRLATQEFSATVPSDITAPKVQSTADVVCYNGNFSSYICCTRFELDPNPYDECAHPTISPISIALIILSIVFALIATIYGTSLVAVFITSSGALYTVIEDITSLEEDEKTGRKRLEFLFLIFGPVIVILANAQNAVLLSTGWIILITIIFGGVCIYFWVIGTVRFFHVWIAEKQPSRQLDQAYFVSILLITFFSLFNLLLTFAWVALGLLLNPSRVVAYFVGFLTVFAVAIFKVNSLAQLMKEAEVRLHKDLFKSFGDKEIKEEDLETADSLKLNGSKLVEYFKDKGLDEKKAEDVAAAIEKFRRFRVRFLIGNLLGTLTVLSALIVFILLGVEAFRVKSGLVSSVGSVLEGVAGAGTAANDKMGDKQQDVQDLVGRFAKRSIIMRVNKRNPVKSLEMGEINMSPSSNEP